MSDNLIPATKSENWSKNLDVIFKKKKSEGVYVLHWESFEYFVWVLCSP